MSSSRRFPLLAALGLLGLTASLRATVWTVDEAVTTALRQNPDTLAARHRIEAAAALLQQAESASRPQVNISGGYTQTNNPLASLGFALQQRNFGFGLNFNRPGWVDDLNVTGTVAYNLYNGGQSAASRDAARAGSRAAEQELSAVQAQLAAEVIKVMLSLHKAREGIIALEAGAKAYEANLANARLRFETGQMLKADLLSLEVEAARTRDHLSSARHGAALAARAFTLVLGSDASEEPVELATEDPALARMDVPDSADLSRRPELLALQEKLQAAEAMVEMARGTRRPSVNAFVAGQYDHGWRYDRSGESVQGGVLVDFNVFDGGRASAKVRQALAEVAQVKAQLRKTTLQIAFEAEKARLAHADLRTRLAVTASAVAQAEESAALSRARFEEGVLLTSELIGNESRLIEIRMTHTHALADERIALIDLRRALGLPLTPR